MLLNDLFEAGVDPRYLSAAERSRSQAQATQRQYWTSPEEKAAARRTELKREKGMAGYGKRHRAAHPEMYPKVEPRPAPRLRDPSTEYSDDYSVWAAGQRDTLDEQGVAEGSLEEIDRRGFLKGLGAAAVAGAAGGALAQSKPADISAELARMTKDDPRIQHNKDVNELARAIYERMVAERGQPMDRRQQQQWLEIARLKAEERFSQYAPGKPSTTKPSAGFPSQPSEYRRSRNLDNFESVDQGVVEGPMPPRPTPKWSPEQALKRQHSRRELARAQFLKKKAEQPPTAGMSAAEKVDKGWRNPNM